LKARGVEPPVLYSKRGSGLLFPRALEHQNDAEIR
jgi:hypothetical protein